MTARLTDYKVLTFDCYGTLIDWETGIWDALQPLLLANNRGDVTRAKALRHSENTRASSRPKHLECSIQGS